MTSKRYRLISVLSLEEQMVDRILFGPFSKVELSKCLTIPGKSGWAPLPVGFKLFESCFTSSCLATDCAAFDWTFPEWVSKLLCELYIDTLINPSAEYCRALRTRWAQVLDRAIFRLPDGTRLLQTQPGMMKSGWYRTIGVNSAAQVLIHDLAALRAGIQSPPQKWTMGDDVLISWPTDLPDAAFNKALETTGILVKQSERDAMFAGFRFSPGRVTPLYPAKHLFMLRYVVSAQAAVVADSFMLMYAMADPEDALAQRVRRTVTERTTITSRYALSWALGLGK
uniref:RNA-directed RNA polymerase n=1 Tax=Zootermopsis nevadensis sobeli-like virus 4 TaxID=3133525 RepID=A0AAT9JA18_9VIRU